MVLGKFYIFHEKIPEAQKAQTEAQATLFILDVFMRTKIIKR